MKARALRARILKDMPVQYFTPTSLKSRDYLLGECRGKDLGYYWILRTSFQEVAPDEVGLFTTGPLNEKSKKIGSSDEYYSIISGFLEFGHLNGRMKYGTSFNGKRRPKENRDGEEVPKKYKYFYVPYSLFPKLTEMGCKIQSKADKELCYLRNDREDRDLDFDTDESINDSEPLDDFMITYSEKVLRTFWAIADHKLIFMSPKDDPWRQVKVIERKNEKKRSERRSGPIVESPVENQWEWEEQ